MKSPKELHYEAIKRADNALNGKGNPNHDPSSGRFTSGGGSSSSGKGGGNKTVSPEAKSLRSIYGTSKGEKGNLKVSLDFAGDNPEKEAKKVADKYGLKMKIENPSGPGGGAPIISFDGPAESIDKLLKWYDS